MKQKTTVKKTSSRSKHDAGRIVEDAEWLRRSLIEQLTVTRKSLGLTQAELAERVGCARMTVQRAETITEGTSLETFLVLALALNLFPMFRFDEGQKGYTMPQDLIHRGLCHERTQRNPEWRSTQREAVFAKAWEEINEVCPVGVQAILPALIPEITQPQATAAATVIQWLGSDVGFAFLKETLEKAGYDLLDARGVAGQKKLGTQRSGGFA